MTDVVVVLVPALTTFSVAIALTPLVSRILYAYRAWKKTPGKHGLDGVPAQEFNRLHEHTETRAPRMGGIIVWLSTLVTISGIALLSTALPSSPFEALNYLSRSQTWVPLAALVLGGIVGLVDDVLVIRPGGTGVPLPFRLFLVAVLGAIVGYWFYAKLDVVIVNIPFADPIFFGPFILPLFVMLMLALYASGVIDGIDGLSGGVFMIVFLAYTVIAFAQSQVDLAALTASISGGLLAFLWFNIPPARFYMSETGTMALTLSLAVIAFMTDSLAGGYGVAALPIIGFVLVITVASNVLQVLSKKFFGVKIFRVAPLHHHFEAIGWPSYKVAMRYWVLSIVCAFLGVVLALSAL